MQCIADQPTGEIGMKSFSEAVHTRRKKGGNNTSPSECVKHVGQRLILAIDGSHDVPLLTPSQAFADEHLTPAFQNCGPLSDIPCSG